MNRFILAMVAILAWHTPYLPTTASAADKETPAAALKRARDMLDAGSSQEAVPALNQLIEKNPQNAEAYSWRGRALANSGDLAKAMADLDRAIELNPRLAQAYVNRATVWLLSKDEAHGLADIETAVKLDPRNARAYVTRGAVHLRIKSTQKRWPTKTRRSNWIPIWRRRFGTWPMSSARCTM